VIGASPWDFWNPFYGLVDDLRIYNSDPGISEVQKVYAEGLPKHLLTEK